MKIILGGILAFFFSFQNDSRAQVPPRVNKIFLETKNAEYKTRLSVLETKLNETVQSQCFFETISKAHLVQTNKRSPEQVAKHLQGLTGTVPVHYYRKNNNVVGYRQPPKPDVYFNLKYHEKRSVCVNAGNAAHEALGHSLGNYTHDFKPTKRRPYSVPYTLNVVFKKCCK